MPDQVVIEYAGSSDLLFLERFDRHLTTLEAKISRREVLIARLNAAAVGLLRFGYFWDLIPFMNLLFVLPAYRGRGIGTQLVRDWETQMQRHGWSQVLTSTQADESAQHFYRKLGYVDVGQFTLPGDSAPELLLHKTLG